MKLSAPPLMVGAALAFWGWQSGNLIVGLALAIALGPDHPTTGGYPVIAILRREAQSALARRRPGDEVRFRLGGGE